MPIAKYVSRIADKVVNYIFNPKNLDNLRYLMFNADMNVLEQSCRVERGYKNINGKKENDARVARMKR